MSKGTVEKSQIYSIARARQSGEKSRVGWGARCSEEKSRVEGMSKCNTGHTNRSSYSHPGLPCLCLLPTSFSVINVVLHISPIPALLTFLNLYSSCHSSVGNLWTFAQYWGGEPNIIQFSQTRLQWLGVWIYFSLRFMANLALSNLPLINSQGPALNQLIQLQSQVQ